jgi:polyhydroxyalkanoate synthesis regulator phasin
MDKWNAKVAEWEAFAKSNNRTIEFEFWGNSEIFERLSKKENEGKLYYWFGKEEFSDEWFKQKLDENIKNLDKRYTPELNFELPIAKIFDGISRDKYFNEQFNSYLDDLLKHYRKAVTHLKEAKVKDHIDRIVSTITTFRQQCEQIDYVEISTINNVGLSSLLEDVRKIVDDLIHKLYEIDSTLKKEKKEKSKYESDTNKFGWI